MHLECMRGCLAVWLMVDQGRIDDLGNHFQGGSTQDRLLAYAVYACIPIFAATAGFLAHYYASKPARSLDSAEGLTKEICVAHRIRLRDQRLLFDIADRAGVPHPATMLAIPEIFDAAVQYVGDEKPFSRSRRARIKHLRQRLFGPGL